MFCCLLTVWLHISKGLLAQAVDRLASYQYELGPFVFLLPEVLLRLWWPRVFQGMSNADMKQGSHFWAIVQKHHHHHTLTVPGHCQWSLSSSVPSLKLASLDPVLYPSLYFPWCPSLAIPTKIASSTCSYVFWLEFPTTWLDVSFFIWTLLLHLDCLFNVTDQASVQPHCSKFLHHLTRFPLG